MQALERCQNRNEGKGREKKVVRGGSNEDNVDPVQAAELLLQGAGWDFDFEEEPTECRRDADDGDINWKR